MSVVARLRAWSLRDYGALAESTTLALRVEVGLRLHPLPRLLAQLGPPRPALPAAVPDVDECRRLSRFAAMPYRYLPIPASCLRESLVLYAMLRRRGAEADLRIGVRREGTALEAHAWVEHPGAESQATAFDALVPAAAASAAAIDC